MGIKLLYVIIINIHYDWLRIKQKLTVVVGILIKIEKSCLHLKKKYFEENFTNRVFQVINKYLP